MAGLILEIRTRGQHQFFPLGRSPTRIGRAFDNDLIVQDPSVSPYHLTLQWDAEGVLAIHPGADENGVYARRTRIDKTMIVDQERLPMTLDIGRTRLIIRDRAESVGPTKLLHGRHSGLAIFDDWRWSTALFVSLLCLTAIDNYLSTPRVLSWESFWRDQAIIVMTAVGLIGGLVLITRTIAGRWDANGAISLVGAVLIVGLLVEEFNGFLAYYLSSETPKHLIDIAWHWLLLPALLLWYFIKLVHASAPAGILVSLALLTPGAYIQIQESSDYFGWFDKFSKEAFYSEELPAWDIRQADALPLKDYIHLQKSRKR